MPHTLRRLLPLPALLLFVASAPAPACPFCSMQGQTLAGEVSGADMVLFGSLTNANDNAQTTDLVIDAVVKKHPVLDDIAKKAGDKKAVTLPKYLPPEVAGQNKFLVFCNVFKKEIDPYRGMAVPPGSDMVDYLTKVQNLPKEPADRLKFFFNYLDNSDPEIGMDAFKEFANASYTDYRAMAKDLPAEKIAGWLRDSSTPGYRIGLYGSLLGHCGKADDAKLLRSLVEDRVRKLSSGVDGVLAGYTMIDPKEGWAYIRGVMGDSSKEFLLRYAALRAARFLHDYRPELVKAKDLCDGVSQLLKQNDIADLAIDDLRKWKCSDMTDQVLNVRSTDFYKTTPVVRRAVLRFALSFPEIPADSSFVTQQRQADPQGVADVEELLKLEQGK
ncbi:MAG TPA: hypothetical protein VMS17_20850 [Gemmataceae bacterium]|nr:hypothetical protein [Gemmataceae bacterium]